MSLVELAPSNLSLLNREEHNNPVIESPTLDNLFNEAFRRTIDAESKRPDRKQVLNAVYDTVATRMSPEADSAVIAYHSSSLLKMFKDRGAVRGDIAIHQYQLDTDEIDSNTESHFWVRYTSYDGKPIIIDPHKKVLGLLSELKSEDMDWPYLNEQERAERVPDEKKALLLDGIVGIEGIPEDPKACHVSMNLMLGAIALGR